MLRPIDQQIDVALRSCFAPSNRAEHADVLGSVSPREPKQSGAVSGEYLGNPEPASKTDRLNPRNIPVPGLALWADSWYTVPGTPSVDAAIAMNNPDLPSRQGSPPWVGRASTYLWISAEVSLAYAMVPPQ